MLHQMQQAGVLSDPAVKHMIDTQGVARTWDALHSRSPSQMLADAGYQATYNEMPWYERLAANIGHGMKDTWHAAEGSARTLANLPFGTLMPLESDKGLMAYKQGIRAQQQNIERPTMAVAREHPGQTFWQQYTGQNLPIVPVMMMGGELGAGRSLLARSGIGSLEGTLYGGMTPTASQNYGTNMLLGGTIGAIAPGVFNVAGRGVRAAWPYVQRAASLFRQGAERKIAGSVINDATGGHIPDVNPEQYVPGFKPTLSMVTQSPKVAAVENAMVGRTLDDPIIAARAQNNTAATRALNSLRPEETPGSASARAATALQGAHDAALAEKNAAWGRIDPLNQYRVPVGNAQRSIGDMIGNLSPTSARMVPPHVGDILNAPRLMPTRHLIDTTLDMGQVAQQARAAGDARAARIAGDVKANMDAALNSPDVRTASGAFVPKADAQGFAQSVQDARDLSGHFYDRFGNKVVQQGLSRFESVPAKTDPTQVLQRVLSDGSPEDVARLDNALGNSTEGRKAVMSWLTNTLKDKASTAANDMEGNPMLSAYRTASILDRNEPLLRKFATPDQYGLLQRFRRSLEANAYPSNVKSLYGNSATAPLINTGNTLFDRAAQVIGGGRGGTETGAAVGAAVGHVPGAYLGAKVGGILDRQIAKALEGRVRNVYELLSQAMADPDLARLLSKEANAQQAPNLIRRIAAKLPKRVTRAAQNFGRQQRVMVPTLMQGGTTIHNQQ